MRLLVAGGGTGGHVYPALAIHRALQARVPELKVLFVGSRRGLEAEILSAHGLPHLLLPGFGLRRAGLGRMLIAPFVFTVSLLVALKAMRTFAPDLVLGTGGFASAAAVAAAIIAGKPRVLQEQNSVPGLANRILARFAHLVLLAYEGSRGWIARGTPCEVVGNPLRFTRRLNRAEAASALGLDPALPVVLFFGGSRGARSLNDLAVELIRGGLGKASLQVLILAGRKDFQRVQQACRGRERVKVVPYLEQIELAYCSCDVAVARAGASSVFELAYFGVPTIFVPYPYAADDHQRRNAEPLVARGAALMIEEDRLEAEMVASLVTELLGDPGRRRTMGQRMQSWVKVDAAERSAELILDLARRGH